MLKNYMKVALRNLRRDPTYSYINVIGLAVGLACFVLIALYIQNELQYDRFHAGADRIFRVTSHYTDVNGTRSFARSNPAIGPTLKNDLTEVSNTVRLQRFKGTMRYQEKMFNETYMFFAESSVFDIFTFPLLRGNPVTALREPNTAVLTQATAQKYFGSEDDPMGKILVLSDTLAFTVTGITKNLPAQSHLQFDILLSFETWKNIQANRGRDLDNLWTSGTYYTYALLSTPDAMDRVQTQLPAYLERYLGDQSKDDTIYSIAMQPLKNIHLKSDLRQELGPNGSLTYVYIFAAVAVVILLISCINFINLSTARSAKRAREVGVRKVIGAVRAQLVKQFLGEAILLSGIAFVSAWAMVQLLLPWFNEFSGQSLTLDLVRHWWSLPAAIGLVMLVGLLAGSYPAFILSSYQPAKVLKGTLSLGRQHLTLSLRQGLVVFQFTLSILIAASTVIALQQIGHMRGHSLGFDQEQILVMPFYWDKAVLDRYETLKSELLRHKAIQQVTASGDVPGRMFTSMSYWVEGMPLDQSHGINALIVDPDFAETYGLSIVAGRDFSPDLAANLGETFILNEAAVAEMGLTPEEVIGKQFRMNTTGPVIGVITDFHFEGLQNELEPLVMTVWPSWFGYISLRLDTANLSETVEHVSKTWQSVVPSRPIEYFFLDDDFNRQYQAEVRFGQVFTVFAALAIFISCLGLFGLAAFTAQQRTKEIGVRKVAGASVSSIVLLLCRSFIRLIVLAILLASPLTYFGMNRWLQSFAYRVDIHWSVFLLTGAAALLVMWLAIGFQSLKAAMANPVKALRYQ